MTDFDHLQAAKTLATVTLDLHAIAERYHKALEAKPSKGPISPDGIAAITDSVADVPDLLAEVERLLEEESVIITNGSLMLDAAEATIARVRALAESVEHRMMATATPSEIRAALEENDTDGIHSPEATSDEVTRFTSAHSARVGKTTLRAGVRDGASDGDPRTEG